MLRHNCQYRYTAIPTPWHGPRNNFVPSYLWFSNPVPVHGLGQVRHPLLVLFEMYCSRVMKLLLQA